MDLMNMFKIEGTEFGIYDLEAQKFENYRFGCVLEK